MGSRGPQPTPTEILKIRGSRRADNREKGGEPQPEKGIPTKPKHITGEAATIWKRLTKMLHDMGVLTKIDGFQIERYAIMFSQWRQLQRVIQKHAENDGKLIFALRDDVHRAVVRNTWAESHRLESALKQIEMQFGLTPAARARLANLNNGQQEKNDKDDKETLFFGTVG